MLSSRLPIELEAILPQGHLISICPVVLTFLLPLCFGPTGERDQAQGGGEMPVGKGEERLMCLPSGGEA